MLNNNWTVYIHRHKDSGKVYVGTTSQPLNNRFRKNGLGYIRGYKPNTKFTKAILDFGWESFEHIIIATDLNEDEAKQMECDLIKKYKSNDSKYGFNSTDGGNGTRGIKYSNSEIERRREYMRNRVVSDETRRKQSIAKKGFTPWNKGKHVGISQITIDANSKPVRTVDGEFPSITACAKFYGLQRKTIQCWLSGKSKPKGENARICVSYIN